MTSIAQQLAEKLKQKRNTIISGDTFDVCIEDEADLRINLESEFFLLEATGEISLYDTTSGVPILIAQTMIEDLARIMYEYEVFEKSGLGI